MLTFTIIIGALLVVATAHPYSYGESNNNYGGSSGIQGNGGAGNGQDMSMCERICGHGSGYGNGGHNSGSAGIPRGGSGGYDGAHRGGYQTYGY